jgi:hypothetical protein
MFSVLVNYGRFGLDMVEGIWHQSGAEAFRCLRNGQRKHPQ